jgi:hypothetical protein
MTAYQLFHLPKATPIASGVIVPGARVSFFLTNTSTPTPVYTTSALSTTHTQPVEADAAGVLPTIYLDPTITYMATINTAADVLLYTVDPVNDSLMSADAIGAVLYPLSTAEQSSGLTEADLDMTYGYGWVERHGAVGDGITDDSDAIQQATDVGEAVFFMGKEYLANTLTQSDDFQRFYGTGNTRIIKNANGALFTSTGDGVELNGIGFRGDASSPTFTGNGIVASGDGFRLINCGSRWCPGRAVLITGNTSQILGTCDIYQTTDATGSGYDIELGVSGTATLYHAISDINSSQPTGGILMTDTGSTKVLGSQFGKLTITSGTSPAGSNGGNYIGNRILGNITVGLSSSVFSGNTIGAVTVTFGVGTSFHSFDSSNAVQLGATITDNSTTSDIQTLLDVPFQSYTPTFSAAGGSPAVGDGALIGRFSKRGRRCKGFIRFTIGSTTNAGTGAWSFSLPAIPTTALPQHGSLVILDNGTGFLCGVSRTATDGTATINGISDGTASLMGATTPITPATGDQYHIEFDFFTD